MDEDSDSGFVGGVILVGLVGFIVSLFILAENSRAEYELAEKKAVKWIQANCNKGSRLVGTTGNLTRVYTCNGTEYTLRILTSQFVENEK